MSRRAQISVQCMTLFLIMTHFAELVPVTLPRYSLQICHVADIVERFGWFIVVMVDKIQKWKFKKRAPVT